MAFKETCKGLLLVWCLWKGRVPIEFRDVCASSVVLPLLALRPALLSHVFLHETSGMDALWALVYDGFFEIIPQLFLAVYYAMSVVGTGLSGWQMVSIFLSGMACSACVVRLGLVSVCVIQVSYANISCRVCVPV